MPPGSARASSRAATFTPSPKMSPSSTTMSPTLMPMRNSIRLSLGTVVLRSAIPACTCRAMQSIHHAAELDEQAVSCRLDEPTVVRGDCRIEQLGPDRLEPCEGAALIALSTKPVPDPLPCGALVGEIPGHGQKWSSASW